MADAPERPAVNIELTDVTRTFGRNKAVDGVSLAAGPGVFGLLGPNGAGKTSLLRLLATMLPPSSDTVRLLDRDPGRPAARTEIRHVGTACSEVALMAEGKVVFRGMPEELAAQGEGHEAGDSPLERGYSAILAASRKKVAA